MNDATVEDKSYSTVPETVETEPETFELESENDGAQPEIAEEVTEEVEAQPEDSSPEKESKQNRVQDRIDEITRSFRETERDRDYWRNLAQQKTEPTTPTEPGKTLADFEYDESQFQTYLMEQAKAEAKAETERTAQMERQARQKAEFDAQESEYSKKHADYFNVTRGAPILTQAMVEIAQASDDAPAILHHLALNQDIARRLATLSPLAMAREIGRMEAAGLKNEPEPQLTQTPAPVPKIKPDATTPKRKALGDPNLTDKEFAEIRRRQIARR